MKNRKLESGASPTLGLDPSVSVGSEEEEESRFPSEGFIGELQWTGERDVEGHERSRVTRLGLFYKIIFLNFIICKTIL